MRRKQNGCRPGAPRRRVEKIRRVALDLPPLPRSSSATRSKPPTVRSLSARCLWAKASNSEPSPSSVATTKSAPLQDRIETGGDKSDLDEDPRHERNSPLCRVPPGRGTAACEPARADLGVLSGSRWGRDPWSAGLLSIGKGGPVGSPRARYFEGAATSPPFLDSGSPTILTPHASRLAGACADGRLADGAGHPRRLRPTWRLRALRFPVRDSEPRQRTEPARNQLRPLSRSAALDAPCRRRSGRRLARPTGLLLASPPPLRSRPSPIFFANADRCAA